MDGEAESYRGVSVLFIDDGRDPVMTLYIQNTGEEQRQIQLINYKTEEELRDLMSQLGFSKRTKREVEVYKTKQRKIQAEMDIENEQKVFDEMKKMKEKKDEIANRVLKMMQENMKKQQDENQKIKV